jgi:hypothetical protein
MADKEIGFDLCSMVHLKPTPSDVSLSFKPSPYDLEM